MTEQTFLLKISSENSNWHGILTDAVTLEKQYFSSLEEIEIIFKHLINPQPLKDNRSEQ